MLRRLKAGGLESCGNSISFIKQVQLVNLRNQCYYGFKEALINSQTWHCGFELAVLFLCRSTRYGDNMSDYNFIYLVNSGERQLGALIKKSLLLK